MNLEVSQKLSNVVSKLYLSIISGHHKKLALMARWKEIWTERLKKINVKIK